MPRTPEAGALAEALAALPVVVERVTCVATGVVVPSYPGGERPSAVVRLSGAGAEGAGESVAWSAAEQTRLSAGATALAPRGRWRLGDWAAEVARRTAAPYERAALEAAAIDLALRQRGTSLVALAGVATRAVRYVVSFARRADAATEAARLLAAAPGLELKVDADPAWGDAVWAGLAGLGAVAVLDFKRTGTAADAERAHDLLPEALIEDPAGPPASWSAALRRRVSLDAAVRHAADVAALPARPAAVNVKPARLGGVLEALRTIAACQADEVAVYVGGMFEVGIGRAQLRALAAVFSPDGPNDIAPIGVGSAPAPRPRALAVDPTRPGFGGCTLGPSPGPC